MEDTEALKKVTTILVVYKDSGHAPEVIAEKILLNLHDLGYRRLTEKPPELVQSEMEKALGYRILGNMKLTMCGIIATAQRDTDWKRLKSGGE